MDPRDGPAKSEMESFPNEDGNDSMSWELPKAQGLYDPQNEHDACGVGFIVAIDGKSSNKVRREYLIYKKKKFFNKLPFRSFETPKLWPNG